VKLSTLSQTLFSFNTLENKN